MKQSDFDYCDKSPLGEYFYHMKQVTGGRFYLILGAMSETLCSEPQDLWTPIYSYTKVVIQTSIYTGNKEEFPEKYSKYIVETDGPEINRYIVPLDVAQEMFDNFCGNKVSIENNLETKPCKQCGSNDKWNSLGKDNNWYCYLHCSY